MLPYLSKLNGKTRYPKTIDNVLQNIYGKTFLTQVQVKNNTWNKCGSITHMYAVCILKYTSTTIRKKKLKKVVQFFVVYCYKDVFQYVECIHIYNFRWKCYVALCGKLESFPLLLCSRKRWTCSSRLSALWVNHTVRLSI